MVKKQFPTKEQDDSICISSMPQTALVKKRERKRGTKKTNGRIVNRFDTHIHMDVRVCLCCIDMGESERERDRHLVAGYSNLTIGSIPAANSSCLLSVRNRRQRASVGYTYMYVYV